MHLIFSCSLKIKFSALDGGAPGLEAGLRSACWPHGLLWSPLWLFFSPLLQPLLLYSQTTCSNPVKSVSSEVKPGSPGDLLLSFIWSLFPRINLILDQRLKNLLPNCMTTSGALGQPQTPVLNCFFFLLYALQLKSKLTKIFFFSLEDCKIHQLSARPVCTPAAPLD